MQEIEVKVRRKAGTDDLPLPKYMTDHASGMDLLAAVDEPLVLEPGKIALIPTGIFLAIPPGYEAQVRPRSGLAVKHGLTIVNAPGTIDSDYRGEVGVILANLGTKSFTVERGMRIAQLVLQQVIRGRLVEQDELDETDRNTGGFGHTGVQS